MTPSDVLLHSQISAIVSQPSSEKSLLQQAGTNTGTLSHIMQRVRDLGTLSQKWDVSIKSFLSGLRVTLLKRRQSLRARENGGH